MRLAVTYQIIKLSFQVRRTRNPLHKNYKLMKISVTSIVLIIAFSSQVLAQGDLRVKGKIRSDSLANQNYLLIYADSIGTLDTLPAGLPGQVLISNGQGDMPYWGNISSGSAIETYGVYATRTTVSSTYPTFTQVSGLTQTITLSDSATIIINTYGSLEAASTSQAKFRCHVQIFQNGTGISNAVQSIRGINNYIPISVTDSWSITTMLYLPSGTYTFDVKACKYGTADNFYAGGNASSPAQNQGALILQVFY